LSAAIWDRVQRSLARSQASEDRESRRGVALSKVARRRLLVTRDPRVQLVPGVANTKVKEKPCNLRMFSPVRPLVVSAQEKAKAKRRRAKKLLHRPVRNNQELV
jgi:hypothetical protein